MYLQHDLYNAEFVKRFVKDLQIIYPRGSSKNRRIYDSNSPQFIVEETIKEINQIKEILFTVDCRTTIEYRSAIITLDYLAYKVPYMILY